MLADFLEKRRHSRFDLRVPLRYRRIQSATQEFKGSLIKDLSQGGLRIGTFEFLPINLRLAMEIPLIAGLKSVEGTARVAWVKKSNSSQQYDVGVEFESLNHGDQQQITKFLYARSEEKPV
ncbi:PilZ domain-containing protein [Candidatus Omnitrophota bacterium]